MLAQFPLAVGQLKFIKAEQLAIITAERVKIFRWKNMVCHHGLPHTIITDNGTQLASAIFLDFCKELEITLKFSSVEHP